MINRYVKDKHMLITGDFNLEYTNRYKFYSFNFITNMWKLELDLGPKGYNGIGELDHF